MFLRVPLSIFDAFIRRYPEEAPKLSENFLSLSIFTRADGVFIPPDLLCGIRSCRRVVGHMTACLAALMWDLDCEPVPFDDRGSKIFGWTASLF